MVKQMWMVRAGENAKLIEVFSENKYVAIGWNELGNLSSVKGKEQVRELVETARKIAYDYEHEFKVNPDDDSFRF